MKRTIALIILFAIAASAASARRRTWCCSLGTPAASSVLTIAGIQAGKPQGLFIHKMPNVGLMDTSAANVWVTDSAAGMTAIMTGSKTNNGVIGLSDATVRGKTDGARLKTLLEHAEERGLLHRRRHQRCGQRGDSGLLLCAFQRPRQGRRDFRAGSQARLR